MPYVYILNLTYTPPLRLKPASFSDATGARLQHKKGNILTLDFQFTGAFKK